MTLTVLWLQLAGAAVVILVASQFLARSADIISFRTGLSRAFVGVLLLATATSLPELGTGVAAMVLVDSPDLAAGDAFGSNLFNLLIIGILDILWRGRPILNSVTIMPVAVLGAAGIAMISLAAMAVVVHSSTTAMSSWSVSPMSVVLIGAFLAAMYLTVRVEQSPESEPIAHDEHHKYASSTLSRAVLAYLLAASAVVVSAVWLAHTGDRLADEMGLEASYVGTQFLALSTSLPELAVSVAAIRLKAPEMAITNVLGSNVFNMGFVLFLDDVAYTDGALWAAVSDIHVLTGLIAVLMTAVVVAGLVYRPRGRPGRFWTFESVLLIGLFVAASLLVFNLS